MRILARLKSNTRVIPFNHQHTFVGTIHKWLGINEQHGKLSLFSFSEIQGKEVTKQGYRLMSDSYFFFSAFEEEIVKKIIQGIQKDPTMFDGLAINEVIIMEDPNFEQQTLFWPSSPIFIKRKNEKSNKIDHIIYDDPNSGKYLTETLRHKMDSVGIVDPGLSIKFEMSLGKQQTRLVHYKNIKNRCSMCPVIIEGNPETKLFAWTVGLGNSTGIGLGSLK